MFTIKYRSFTPSANQPADGPTYYDPVEQISGPYELISQEMDDGYMVIYCHREGGAPGLTIGPWSPSDRSIGENPPRPTVYVMNEHGATVAKYDL